MHIHCKTSYKNESWVGTKRKHTTRDPLSRYNTWQVFWTSLNLEKADVCYRYFFLVKKFVTSGKTRNILMKISVMVKFSAERDVQTVSLGVYGVIPLRPSRGVPQATGTGQSCIQVTQPKKWHEIAGITRNQWTQASQLSKCTHSWNKLSFTRGFPWHLRGFISDWYTCVFRCGRATTYSACKQG